MCHRHRTEEGRCFFVIGDSLLTERKTFDLYYEDFDLLGCKRVDFNLLGCTGVENAAKRKGKFGKEVLRRWLDRLEQEAASK